MQDLVAPTLVLGEQGYVVRCDTSCTYRRLHFREIWMLWNIARAQDVKDTVASDVRWMRTVAVLPGTSTVLHFLHNVRFTDGSLCNST